MKLNVFIEAMNLLLDSKLILERSYNKIDDAIHIKYRIVQDKETLTCVEMLASYSMFNTAIDEIEKITLNELIESIKYELSID